MNNAQSATPMTPGADQAPAGRLEAMRAHRLRDLIGLAVCLALAAGLTTAGNDVLNDADTLWHIAVGRDIWQAKSFPHVDLYSHTFAGEPWIAKEWLSQILLYGVYAMGGWNGVVIATVVVMLVVFWQLYLALTTQIKPIFAAAVAIAAVAICSPIVLARPHILVLPVVFLFVSRSWAAAQDGKAPPFWLLGVMCLWANMHGSFTFGFFAAALAFLRYLYERRKFRDAATYRWIAFLALCPVASIVHPYGVEAIWSTVSIAQSEALPYIIEWRAFSATKDVVPELAIIALIAAALASGLRVNIVSALFVCFLLHLYFTHMRFIYLLFLLTPMLVAKDIAFQYAAVSARRWTAQFGDSGFEGALARRSAPAIAVSAAALFALLVALLNFAKWAPAQSYPIAAIDAARSNGVSGNVLNHYNFGGALIFEGVPTFVDGRADRLFQRGFMPDIAKMKHGDVAFFYDRIARYDIGWTILPPADARVGMLDDMPGWKRIHEDDLAVVHARNGAEQ